LGQSPAALQAVNALESMVRAEIAQDGPMPFRRFMELALYHPEHGYYERAATPIGRRGDFFTSVSVGPLFGQLLAWRFAGWLDALGSAGDPVQIVEVGAHDGTLATDILGWLSEHRPDLLARLEYWFIEPSPRRRSWQEATLGCFSGARVHWWTGWEELPTTPVRGVIFANELLDAFPLYRIGWDAQARHWFEWLVIVEGEGLDWGRRQLDPELRTAALASVLGRAVEGATASVMAGLERVLPDGFSFEYCPAATEWWRQAAQSLGRGHLLTFDYGLGEGEMIRPERVGGTLRAYRDHRVSDDLLADPGEQDLTAHVNFSALQHAGEATGLRTESLVAQEQFLTAIVAEAMRQPTVFGDWTDEHTRQFRTLAHPAHLGRSFRVLVQGR
jgi:SAM-dependent MidA family methyltransferase